MFKRNESTVDRIIRVVLGGLLLWIGLWPLSGRAGSFGGLIVALVGIILLITALTGFCLIYKLLGISTSEE